MSTIRCANIGPLTGNTSVIADPGFAGGMSLVSLPPVSLSSTTTTIASGIPSWVRRITINGIGTVKSGASSYNIIQLGTSGGFTTSGYTGVGWLTSSYITSSSTGLPVSAAVNGTATQSFFAILTLFNTSTNQWAISGNYIDTTNSFGGLFAGYVTLSSAITQVRLNTSSGTDTWSAGSVNCMYE